HSQAMAAQSSLYHNPSLTTAIHNWQAVGENVGEGPDVSDIHVAFMNSPEHRANILDHDFTQVGVGVSVDHNGIVWVTEDFREPMSSAPAPDRKAAALPSVSAAASRSAAGSAWASAQGRTVTEPDSVTHALSVVVAPWCSPAAPTSV